MEATIGTGRAFKEAAGLAAKGWKLVRLNDVTAGGRCTCGRPDCPTPGKHPAGGAGWPERATDDEETIASWFDSDEPVNIGVRLGANSGIIDVEFDSPEGEAVLKKFGLDRIDTPAYSSGRGVHRIFQHEDWMPDAGVVKVDGLEVRIGGGEKASQSVIPPSWHWSGKRYQWLPGRSPEDVEPARLPESFREAVMAAAGSRKGTGCIRDAREAAARRIVTQEGGRHHRLVGEASDLCYMERNLDDPEAVSRIVARVLAVNQVYCDPPKQEAEVVRIVEDQARFYLSARRAGDFEIRSGQADDEARLLRLKHPLERCGLEVVGHGAEREYRPGKWSVSIVDSSPAEYVLAVYRPRGDCTVAVSLSADDWLSAAAVARRILEATKDVDVTDPNPEEWRRIWNGYSVKHGSGPKRQVRGLKSQLLESASVQESAPEDRRHAVVAGVLLDYLSRFEDQSGPNVTSPSSTGQPRWIHHEGKPELWFDMQVVCQKAMESSGVEIAVNERRDVLRRLRAMCGVVETTNRRAEKTTNSRRYYRLTKRHLLALEEISGRVEAGSFAKQEAHR
jgi:hypothetical protein